MSTFIICTLESVLDELTLFSVAEQAGQSLSC